MIKNVKILRKNPNVKTLKNNFFTMKFKNSKKIGQNTFVF